MSDPDGAYLAGLTEDGKKDPALCGLAELAQDVFTGALSTRGIIDMAEALGIDTEAIRTEVEAVDFEQ